MKNMLGDEVEPRTVTCEWLFPHLNIFINGHWAGMVSPNGWQGYSMDVHHRLGEPIMTNLNLWHSMSFNEMRHIMYEYEQHMDVVRTMQFVLGRIAEEKAISFDDALKLVKERNIPTIA